MGTIERREREKKEQRQRILDAALLIITEQGFAALSMRKLAERIEYSAASIYLYFKNREQIARELSEAGFAELLEALITAGANKDAQKAIYAVSAAYVRFGLKYPERYRLIFMGDFGYMEAVYAERDSESTGLKVYAALVELSGRLKQAGYTGGRASPTAIAETIWSALHGVVSLSITCAGSLSTTPEALAKFAVEMIVGGLQHGSPKRGGAPG